MFTSLYYSKPIMKMNDHTSPVSFLFISESEGKLYSVSIENCVKVSTPYLLLILCDSIV